MSAAHQNTSDRSSLLLPLPQQLLHQLSERHTAQLEDDPPAVVWPAGFLRAQPHDLEAIDSGDPLDQERLGHVDVEEQIDIALRRLVKAQLEREDERLREADDPPP